MTGRTQNSDLKRRTYDRLRSSDSLKEGFLFNFQFFSFGLTQIDFVVFKVHLTHVHAYANPCHMLVLPNQKKTSPLYKAYE
jgi:hypothetical protein